MPAVHEGDVCPCDLRVRVGNVVIVARVRNVVIVVRVACPAPPPLLLKPPQSHGESGSIQGPWQGCRLYDPMATYECRCAVQPWWFTPGSGSDPCPSMELAPTPGMQPGVG